MLVHSTFEPRQQHEAHFRTRPQLEPRLVARVQPLALRPLRAPRPEWQGTRHHAVLLWLTLCLEPHRYALPLLLYTGTHAREGLAEITPPTGLLGEPETVAGVTINHWRSESPVMGWWRAPRPCE